MRELRPNRAAPDGSLHADAARGLFTGNRGILHNAETGKANGRRWTTRAWICCALEWKGRKREVWGKNGRDGGAGWSELFFLDEVTALAAGHRPCHLCRRETAMAFRGAWRVAHGEADAPAIDAILHGQRRHSARGAPQRLSPIDLPGLPDGTVVDSGGQFFALKERRALPWSFSGYGKPESLGEIIRRPVTLVTPRSLVGVLKAGYRLHWHASAGQDRA